MKITPIVKKTILFAWLLVVPVGMWLTYQVYPPSADITVWEVLPFLVLMSVVAAMPLVEIGRAHV